MLPRNLPLGYAPLRTAIPAICLVLAASVAQAVTLSVGPSAGQPGSACEYRTPQAAINALPPPQEGETHAVLLEAGTYLGADAAIDIDGHRVTVKTVWAQDSKCASAIPTGRAVLAANSTALADGRTVVVRNDGNLELIGVQVSGNTRGGILVRDSTAAIRDSVISGNTTPTGGSGAGIVVERGFVDIANSQIFDNQAAANGGGVFCAGPTGPGGLEPATVTIDEQSSVSGNRAIRGGGIYLFRDCRAVLTDGVVLSQNVASLDGGAVATDPGTSGDVGNSLFIGNQVQFSENHAGQEGGAISLAGPKSRINRILSVPASASFVLNEAGRFGGAISVVGTGAEGALAGAQFVLNAAGQQGGAVSVRGGALSLVAACAAGNTENENYCARFDGNSVPDDGGPSDLRRGGALAVCGGILIVDGFAFRRARGPNTVGTTRGGVIASVCLGGRLKVSNSLVFDNPLVTSDTQKLFQLDSGTARLSFNTIVGTGAGTAFSAGTGTTSEFIGNIIVGHSRGLVGFGAVTSTCNNMQIGPNDAPLDPQFVTTSAGRYRLGENSPMIGGALGCDDSDLPENYEFPQKDLDGNERVGAGQPPRDIDLGAFEFVSGSDVIFADGFEPTP